MAQLKDTVVSGSLRATDTIYTTTAQFQILKAPSTSGGSDYGIGTAGYVLKTGTNGVYWSALSSNDIPTLSIIDKTSGTLTIARGGTGATTAADARTNLGLGSMATETATDYLKLSGGIMTGAIKRYYSSASTDPMLSLCSNNQDVTVLHVGHGGAAGAIGSSYYKIVYKGTGNSPNNYLKLIAASGNSSTETEAMSIDENGNIIFSKSVAVNTINGLTLTKESTGFSIAGGVNSRLLTVAANVTLTGGTSTYIAYYYENGKIGGHSIAHFGDTYSSTTTNGQNAIVLGNAIDKDSNNSAYGQVSLYSSGTKGTHLISAQNSTNWYVATLQAKTGTVALTSDVTTAEQAAQQKVYQTSTASSNWRKVLLHNVEQSTSAAAVANATSNVYAASGVSVQPTTGTLRAGAFNTNDKVTLQWNDNNATLDFVFI